MFSGRGPYVPDPSDSLKDVFEHLWTRLNEAEFIASALALQEPGTKAFDENLSALRQVANVSSAYSHMRHLLHGTEA